MARPDNIRDLEEVIRPSSIIPGATSDTSLNSKLETILTTSNKYIFVSERILPWWSRKRDEFLFETMIRSDMLSSAIFVTSARLFSVPFNIIPKEKDNRHNREIAKWSDMLLKDSWESEMFRAIIDWQTQDNGMFLEIMGGGDPSGPIEPTLVPGTSTYLYGLGMRHLDSQRATRTGDPEYPVRYRAKDARGRVREFKLHHSRVLFDSQMPSPREDKKGVGMSGVSRTISHVIHLQDIDILKEEWLGSRPVSEIIFGKGMSAGQIEVAFTKADEKANAESLHRFAKIVFMGIDGNPELVRAAGLERIALKRLPEGYDEEKAVTVAINVLAMGLGFDARTLWPATVRGATRADAEVQHLKTMKMTPGIWVETLIRKLTKKYCPVSCLVTADQQDDEQDQIVAGNRQARAALRQTMLDSKQIDLLVCYEMMLEDGDLSELQFEYLVGRMEAGEIVDPTAPVEEAPAVPGQANPDDGDGDGLTDEAPADEKEDFPGQALIRNLFKGEVTPITNGYH